MLKTKLWGILALVLVFGLALTGCDEVVGGGSKSGWKLSQDGGISSDTTELIITFDSEPSLSPADFDISGPFTFDETGGNWDMSGKVWHIPVTVTGTNTASVTISLGGIISGPQTTLVYKTGSLVPSNYTVTANGTSNTAASTQLTLVFEKAVSDLTIGEITLTSVVGSATALSVDGNGTNWTLFIDVTQQGTITVKINHSGVNMIPKTVTVYKVTGNTLTITGLSQYNGSGIMIGLFNEKEDIRVNTMDPVFGSEGSISSNTVTVEFWTIDYDDSQLWTGTGSFYVGLMIMTADGVVVRVSNNKVSFTASNKHPTMVFSNTTFPISSFGYTFAEISGLMEVDTPSAIGGAVTLDIWLTANFGMTYAQWKEMIAEETGMNMEMYQNSAMSQTATGAWSITNTTTVYLELPLMLLLMTSDYNDDPGSGSVG